MSEALTSVVSGEETTSKTIIRVKLGIHSNSNNVFERLPAIKM